MKNILATQPVSHCANINSHHEHNQNRVSFQDKAQGYISELSQKYTMVNIHLGGYSTSDIRGLMQEFCWGNHLFISTAFIEIMCKNMDSFKKGKYILEQTLESFLTIALLKFVATGILILPQKKFCWHIEIVKGEDQIQEACLESSSLESNKNLPKKIRCQNRLSQYFKGERLKQAVCPPALRKSFVELSEKLNLEKLDFMLKGDNSLGQLKKYLTQYQKQLICYRIKILRFHWQESKKRAKQQLQLQWNQYQIHSVNSKSLSKGRSAYQKQTAVSRYLDLQRQSQQRVESSVSEKDSLQTKQQEKNSNKSQGTILLSSGLQAVLSSQNIDF